MGKYRAYPEYKDSGVEWVQEIPSHWEIVRNVGLFEERNQKNYPDEELLAVTIKYGVLKQTELAELTDRKDTASDDKTNYKLVIEGDIAYNKMRMWQGAIGVSEHRGIVSPAYVILKPTPNVDSRFFYYQYKTPGFVNEAGRYSYGLCDDMNSLRYKDFRALYSVTPPQKEQTQIAAFLDRETARIDRLIARQEELIALLKEKRQAVISHAVTKGLDPNAPMKDSGVEWLGEIPAHWEVAQLRRLLKKLEQGWSPEASNIPAQEGEKGVLKLSAIKCGIFKVLENKTLDANLDLQKGLFLKKNDLLLTRANTPALVGDACVVDNIPQDKYILCDLVYRLTLEPCLLEKHACYWLISSFGRVQIVRDARGSSMTMAKISQEHIKSWILPIPPSEEQRSISKYLDKITAKIDCAIAIAANSITLLQERRTALISAAVTGKIDVREVAL